MSAAFWATACPDCAHPKHEEGYDVRCGVVAGGDGHPMPEPVYCPCLRWEDVRTLVARTRADLIARLPAALREVDEVGPREMGLSVEEPEPGYYEKWARDVIAALAATTEPLNLE